jgi:chitinase
MKKHSFRTITLFFLLISGFAVSASADIWISAYYTGWSLDRMPPDKIDFSAITHLFHFSVLPNNDGTLNDTAHKVTEINSDSVITIAHAASVPVILSIGGWGQHENFLSATSDKNRSRFVSNIVSIVQTRGYDGIDLDWEPLLPSDEEQYLAFVEELCDTIDKLTPRPLLTAAIASCKELFAEIHFRFDQLNIMTYDMSGPWENWVTWHNSPIYDGGNTFPVSGDPLPSTDAWLNMFLSAGIPSEKLGIGLPFYGFVWAGGTGTPAGGATAPCQEYSTAPVVKGNVHFSYIMDNIYDSAYYKWDENAAAAYLSIDNPGSDKDSFVSYDNEESARRKIQYAREKGIGGVIIYELDCGYRTEMPEGQKDPLLNAVKTARLNTREQYSISYNMPGTKLARMSFSNNILTVFSGINLAHATADILTTSGKIIVSGISFIRTRNNSLRWTSVISDSKMSSGAYMIHIKTKDISLAGCITDVNSSDMPVTFR